MPESVVAVVRSSHRTGVRAAVVALAAGGVGVLAPTALGQWSVTNLHPSGSFQSIASGANGGLQGGVTSFGAGNRASLWSRTAASRIELHPAGVASSEILGMSATQQVGYTRAIGGAPKNAAVWSGTAASWTNLHPAGASASDARAASGTQQVGIATIAGQDRASLWTGSAGSWIDLNPAGAGASYATATDGSRQFGYSVIGGQTLASAWSGSSGSWSSFHPSSANASYIFAADASSQGGAVIVGSVVRASLWSGTASSWVDLHPAGAGYSTVTDVAAGTQAGWINVGSDTGPQHAGVWEGSAASWFDLHSVLPAAFTDSEARGIATDGSFVYVTGYGYNADTGRIEALVWSRPVPAPGAAALLGLGGVIAARRRRGRRGSACAPRA